MALSIRTRKAEFLARSVTETTGEILTDAHRVPDARRPGGDAP